MDTFAGLLGTGLYMNQKEVPVKKSINSNRIKRTQINGNNIYDNAKHKENKMYVDNIADARYKLADDPINTGVIPNFYNQLQSIDKNKIVKNNIENFEVDSVFSNETDCSQETISDNIDNDHMAFFKKSNMLKNVNNSTLKSISNDSTRSNQDEKNNFLNQFDELTFDNSAPPVSSNNIPHKMGKNSNITK